MSSGPTTDSNPFNLEQIRDPYPADRRLRDETPIIMIAELLGIERERRDSTQSLSENGVKSVWRSNQSSFSWRFSQFTMA